MKTAIEDEMMSINALLAEIVTRLNAARRAPNGTQDRELASLETMVRNARTDWIREENIDA